MIARKVSKPNTQAMVKALRAAGLPVTKSSMGAYTCEHPKAGLLFKALPGRNDYLVRMREDLFA